MSEYVEKYLSSEGFFIEAGAHDGISASVCLPFEQHGWKGINVEPCKELYERLCKNRPYSKNVSIALSDKDGTDEFYYSTFCDGLFSQIGSVHRELPHDLPIVNKYPVKTMTYKSFIEKYEIDAVDLFVLDVEGFEIQVVRGMAGCPVIPKLIYAEHVYVGLDNLVRELGLIAKYEIEYTDPSNVLFTR